MPLPFLKPVAQSVLRRLGYKAVPFTAQILPRPETGCWYETPGDRVLCGHRPGYLDDAEFRLVLDRLVQHEAFEWEVERYPVWRLHTVWGVVRWCRGVRGDVVEFGTYRGGTACVLSASLDAAGDPRRLWLYDTFAGLPDVGLSDHERSLALAGRYANTSPERVRTLLGRHADRAELRVGTIPETLDGPGPEAIAFLHVDLNATAPTVAALEWAWPRWSPGGVCVLDDYLWVNFEEQRTAVDQFFSARGLRVVDLPTGQGLVVNRT